MSHTAWLTCNCEALHSFCSISVAGIHGRAALVTGLALFPQESAMLSCLRPQPAAADLSVC